MIINTSIFDYNKKKKKSFDVERINNNELGNFDYFIGFYAYESRIT